MLKLDVMLISLHSELVLSQSDTSPTSQSASCCKST